VLLTGCTYLPKGPKLEHLGFPAAARPLATGPLPLTLVDAAGFTPDATGESVRWRMMRT
jgi:hypothetical protein